MHVAVLDLGSNSFHLLVADVRHDGAIVTLLDEKEPVRLGAPALEAGRIGPIARDRALAAVDRLLEQTAPLPGVPVIAVATSVLREARDGPELAELLRRRHGLEVEILDGHEEARLSYAGAYSAVPDCPGATLVADVGGGSVELAIGLGPRCVLTHSLPIGVLRMRDRFCPADGVMTHIHVQAIANTVRRALALAAGEVRALAPRTLLLTGGTPRRIARVGARGAAVTEPPPTVDLCRSTVSDVATSLVGRDPSELARFAVDEPRRDTIAPGAVLVATLMRLAGFDRATVVRSGLREGVVLRELARRRAQDVRAFERSAVDARPFP